MTLGVTTWLSVAALLASCPLQASPRQGDIPDITGNYEFLTADDTLAILEEEGKLKGYVDVLQDEDESDAILSYPIRSGTREGTRVEFVTGKIHQKYYRFSGKVERGPGKTENDPEYVRLVGSLETVTVNGETGEETPQRAHVVFKSKGREHPSEE
jgi:hypothetical protein